MNNYEIDLKNATEIFDTDILRAFLYKHADEAITTEGRTLISEISEVAKMSARAYVKDGVGFYNWRKQFAEAEVSEEEKAWRANRLFRSAAKKIIFLSTICKLMEGSSFLKKFISTENNESCKVLVDAFMFIVDHYDEF